MRNHFQRSSWSATAVESLCSYLLDTIMLIFITLLVSDFLQLQ